MDEAKPKERRKIMGHFIRRKVVFKYKGAPGSNVFVAGTFNEWNPEKKQLKDAAGDGTYSCICYLLPGRYEYKFVVDGIWQIDVLNPDYVPNDQNSMNSVLMVK